MGVTQRWFAILLGSFCFAVLPAVASAGDYGALAYSRRNGALGWSYNYDDEDAARERALDECRKYARDCKIGRVFTNTCVMVARDGTRMGWSWDGTTDARRRRAMQECRSDGGRSCKIVAQFCTGDAEEDN
jgi:hypothetical protein